MVELPADVLNHYCSQIADSGRTLKMFWFSYRVHRLLADCCEQYGPGFSDRLLPGHGRMRCR